MIDETSTSASIKPSGIELALPESPIIGSSDSLGNPMSNVKVLYQGETNSGNSLRTLDIGRWTLDDEKTW
jgi:hypothetical protein